MAATPLPLVPGRECGSCNVCCVALTIRDPDLQKAQGIRCVHNGPDNRCAIYDARPHTCRTFHCGWRHLKWVRDGLRPDQSGVLVRLQREKGDGTGPPQLGVVFTILEERGLIAEGIAESMAAAVAARVPLFLEVPGPPGYTSGLGQVNAVLEEAVLAHDKAAMLDMLRQAWQHGHGGDNRPVMLEPP